MACSARSVVADMPSSVAVSFALDEVEFIAIRAQGCGGQNVNKVSNAIHLRFDTASSSLGEEVKARILAWSDQRISRDGVIIIKAQRFRSLEKNREDALLRLQELLTQANHVLPARTPTRPTRSARRQRVDSKVQRGQVKALRGRISDS